MKSKKIMIKLIKKELSKNNLTIKKIGCVYDVYDSKGAIVYNAPIDWVFLQVISGFFTYEGKRKDNDLNMTIDQIIHHVTVMFD